MDSAIVPDNGNQAADQTAGPAAEPRPKLIRPWRSRWREQQHAADHSASVAAPAVLAHPLVPTGDPQWVDSAAALQSLLAQLRAAGAFAFDTEFIGEDAYHPRVCLVQIATPGLLAIVDPLAVPDLRPFWDLVVDDAVEKTVHAGAQDLAFAWRSTGRGPANIFDTQICSAFAGQPHSQGLGKMVTALLGADVGTSAKFTRWDARPLTPLQQQYAANDVRYLPAIRAMLAERLTQNGNANFAQGACADAFREDVFIPAAPEARLKIQALHRWSGAQLGALHALTQWRESLAVREDLPPRVLFPDAVMADLVRHVLGDNPENDSLDAVKGFPRPIRQAHGDEIMAVIHAGAKQKPPRPKRPKRITEKQAICARDLAEAMWAKANALCAARQIDLQTVTSKRDLHRLACLQAAGIEPEEPIRVLDGWRRELLGDLTADSTAPPAA